MFNPSLHTATNKPIGLINKPVDARTYYYDATNFVYRPYVSNAEVLAYLVGNQRVGQFSIIINTGGSIVNGVITGGTNAEWWFKNGILDSDLLFKGASGGTQWGEIGGDINYQTDLVGLIDDSISSAILQPIRLPYPLGTLLPITVDYTSYREAYGDDPEIQVKYKATGQNITSSATIIMGDMDNPVTSFTVDAATDGDPDELGTPKTDGAIIIVIKQ